jgi:hypothetical protein
VNITKITCEQYTKTISLPDCSKLTNHEILSNAICCRILNMLFLETNTNTVIIVEVSNFVNKSYIIKNQYGNISIHSKDSCGAVESNNIKKYLKTYIDSMLTAYHKVTSLDEKKLSAISHLHRSFSDILKVNIDFSYESFYSFLLCYKKSYEEIYLDRYSFDDNSKPLLDNITKQKLFEIIHKKFSSIEDENKISSLNSQKKVLNIKISSIINNLKDKDRDRLKEALKLTQKKITEKCSNIETKIQAIGVVREKISSICSELSCDSKTNIKECDMSTVEAIIKSSEHTVRQLSKQMHTFRKNNFTDLAKEASVQSESVANQGETSVSILLEAFLQKQNINKQLRRYHQNIGHLRDLLKQWNSVTNSQKSANLNNIQILLSECRNLMRYKTSRKKTFSALLTHIGQEKKHKTHKISDDKEKKWQEFYYLFFSDLHIHPSSDDLYTMWRLACTLINVINKDNRTPENKAAVICEKSLFAADHSKEKSL